jgi:hypothetical protein
LWGWLPADHGCGWDLDYLLAAVALRHTSYTTGPAQPIA